MSKETVIEQEARLRALRNRLSATEGELAVAQDTADDAAKRVHQLLSKAGAIRAEIHSLESQPELVISEHAMLRYIERVMGIDIDKVREAILDDAAREAIASLGNGTYPVGDTHRVCIKGNRVVTVLTVEMK